MDTSRPMTDESDAPTERAWPPRELLAGFQCPEQQRMTETERLFQALAGALAGQGDFRVSWQPVGYQMVYCVEVEIGGQRLPFVASELSEAVRLALEANWPTR